ncbi:glycosyltransferase family 2 protein [Segatella hominis]|uniref:Glycosyltransferase family 2 protein n=1 Tax=Segatella hominis TaxID=2518605 RepID=A0A4Y8VJB8_9BACT|nr:glycosyltransferase family 2 protein [Segatella hominis]TFH80518.1 glycosyltransferase family 2 protein [Segatella hominis]
MSNLVSVIVPNYNHAQYLDIRLKSILAQTYTDFEIIILDDNSIDNSKEIIKRYEKDVHISHIICNKTNSGSPFIQWNRGFQYAKGDLIWIAESDDCCEPTFLENVVAEFERNSNLSFAFSRSIKIDENGNKGNILQPMFASDVRLNGKEFNMKFLIWGNKVWNASSVVFRKSNALTVNKQYMDFRGAGDWLFWIEMAEKGDVAVISEPLNYYRIYSKNTTNFMRMNGMEDVEDKKIYDFIISNYHLSLINKVRLQKCFIYKILYENKYTTADVCKESLRLWKPSLFLKLLAYVSHLKYDKR